jgi:hypothetical protein
MQEGKNLFLNEFVTEVQYGLPGKHKEIENHKLFTLTLMAGWPKPYSKKISARLTLTKYFLKINNASHKSSILNGVSTKFIVFRQ